MVCLNLNSRLPSNGPPTNFYYCAHARTRPAAVASRMRWDPVTRGPTTTTTGLADSSLTAAATLSRRRKASERANTPSSFLPSSLNSNLAWIRVRTARTRGGDITDMYCCSSLGHAAHGARQRAYARAVAAASFCGSRLSMPPACLSCHVDLIFSPSRFPRQHTDWP